MFSTLEANCVKETHCFPRLTRSDDEPSLELDALPQRGFFNAERGYVLLWKGPVLDVFAKNRAPEFRVLSCFNFSALFCDKSIHISCVTDLNDYENDYLVVVLNRKVIGSIICLIDIRLNRVIKCIESPFRISSLIAVDSFREQSNLFSLADELKNMCGVVLVGTEGGLVAFIDLCMDQTTDTVDVLIPDKIKFIVKESTLRKTEFVSSRKHALIHNQHICLPLNGESQHKGKFIYRSHDGSVLAKFQNQYVAVTALEYILQTNAICVGFSFGGFQIWNARNLLLECSCSLDNDLPPVIKFTFQEPENDPKNYCYLWVIRGIEIGVHVETLSDISTSTAAFLYALAFTKKEWIPGCGFFYSNFDMCAIRFEYHMTTNTEPQEYGSRCKSSFISCGTLCQTSQSYCKPNDDENMLIDSSLCFFCWEAWDELNSQSLTFFGIFDLNQWYQAQMPPYISLDHARSAYCSFFGLYSLSDVCNAIMPDAILNVKVDSQSISAFRPQNNQSDIAYYPVSLSFDVTVLTENKIFEASYLGVQKQCLASIVAKGPDVLVDPSEVIKSCVHAGLFLPEKANASSVASQREMLLTLTFQNDYMPFITQVIQSWSSDNFTQIGCNCKFILDWIWKQVSEIKTSIDVLSKPLFAFGEELSENSLEQLSSHEKDLRELYVLLKSLQIIGTPTTEQGSMELITRIEVTELISQYLRVILWLYGCSLLPERLEGEALKENEAFYPRVSLSHTYETWRNELSSINPTVIKKHDLLIIDGLIECLPSISSLWKQAQGNGWYPPPTVHALILVYLLESLPLDLKHFIMLYFLCDMATYLSESQIEITEKIKIFPATFHLKPGLTKLVQGIWALDHKLFDFALTTLGDPCVKNAFGDERDNVSSIYSSLQLRILTSFLYQGQHRHAQQFMTTCNSFVIDSPLKEKLHLSILLTNQKMIDAFLFQRLCRNENNSEDILLHFFLACEQMNLIDKLFKMPLDVFEEDALIYYLLHVSPNRNNKHLLILYFLLNNKIVDASNFIEMCVRDTNEAIDEEFVNRSQQFALLINSYLSSLPSSLSRLANEINAIENEKVKFIKSNAAPVIVKPSPSQEEVVSSSDVIRLVMEQMEEWKKCKKDNFNPPSTPFRQRIVETGLLLTQNSPFIRRLVKENHPISSLRDTSYLSTAPMTGESIICIETKLSKAALSSKENESSLFDILRTPTVKRTASPKIANISHAEPYFTPTSILKVKNLMRDSSPSLKKGLIASSGRSSKERGVKTKLRFSIPGVDNSAEQSSSKQYADSEMSPSEEKTVHQQKASFVFSPPLISPQRLNKHEKEPSTPTNLPSFVFSPPLTRSRSKQRRTANEVLEFVESSMTPTKLQGKQSQQDASHLKQTPRRHSMQLRPSSSKKKTTAKEK